MEEETIRKLIYAGYESTRVDYKRSIPWANETKYGIIKDVMAFANAGGGYVVVGYDEKKPTKEASRTGVQNDHLGSWETTNVNRDVNEFSKPPIDVNVVNWEDESEGKKYVVLSIPCHRDLPHICVQDKHDQKGFLVLHRAAIYFRTKNKTCEEISDPTDLTALLKRCLLIRRDELLKDFEQILQGRLAETTSLEVQEKFSFEDMNRFESVADRYNPFGVDSGLVFWQVLAGPVADQKTFAPEAVEAALKAACVDYVGWPYVFYLPPNRDVQAIGPRYDDDGIFAYSDNGFNERQRFDYWKLLYDGIFYSKNLTRESKAGKPIAFDFKWQSRYIAEALIALGRIYHSLHIDLDEHIEVLIKFSPTKDMIVSSLKEDVRYRPSQPFQGESLSYRKKVLLVDLKNKPAEVAAGLTLALLGKLGYDHPPSRDHLIRIANDHLKGGQRPPGCE